MRRPSSPFRVAGVLLGLTLCVGTSVAAQAEVMKFKYEAVCNVENLKPTEGSEASSAVPVEMRDVGKRESYQDSAGKKKSAAEPTNSKWEESVVLGTDQISCSKSDGESTQYDFKNKRIRILDSKTKTYVDVSLFPIIGFRDAEVQNRVLLSKILEKSGASLPKDMFDMFSISCDLGVMPPEGVAEPEFTSVEKDKTIIFTHNGKTVTEVTFTDTPLSDSFSNTYGKAILYKCKLHPSIWKQIVARKKVIDKLSYSSPKLPGSVEHISLRLLSTGSDAGDVTIPEGFKRTFDAGSPLRSLQEKIVASEKPVVMPTRDGAIAEAKQFVKDKHYVDAFLSLIEYSLATGDGASDAMRAIRDEIGDNPTISRIATLLAPKSEEDAKEFLEEFDEIEKEVHKKGYVLEIFKGNLAQSIHEPADKMFLKALNANPLITGAYKDLGESYESQWQMDLAWDCFDMARKLCPDHPLLGSVNDMEKLLQDRHPEYF